MFFEIVFSLHAFLIYKLKFCLFQHKILVNCELLPDQTDFELFKHLTKTGEPNKTLSQLATQIRVNMDNNYPKSQSQPQQSTSSIFIHIFFYIPSSSLFLVASKLYIYIYAKYIYIYAKY